MGNLEIKRKLWEDITRNQVQSIRKIVKQYPQFLNTPISEDNNSTILTRSAYLNRTQIISELISLGADLNESGESNISPLMWAAARGNMESLQLLMKFGANPSLKGAYQMTAIDFSVLYGSYTTAEYLSSNGFMPTKTIKEYNEIKALLHTSNIDYESILASINRKAASIISSIVANPERVYNNSVNYCNNIKAEHDKTKHIEITHKNNKIMPYDDSEDKLKIIEFDHVLKFFPKGNTR